jgi:hypothetical protein
MTFHSETDKSGYVPKALLRSVRCARRRKTKNIAVFFAIRHDTLQGFLAKTCFYGARETKKTPTEPTRLWQVLLGQSVRIYIDFRLKALWKPESVSSGLRIFEEDASPYEERERESNNHANISRQKRVNFLRQKFRLF